MAVKELPRPSMFKMIASGGTALSEVPKLRKFMAMGMALNYLLMIVLGAFFMGILYYYLFAPWLDSLLAWGSEGNGFMAFVSGILRFLLWIAQLVIMAGTMVLTLIVSLSLLSLWFETLVGKIMAHCRQDESLEPPPFEIKAWISSMGRALGNGVYLMTLAIMAMLIGLIPVIGPVIAIIINSYLIGREIRDPYLDMRAEIGETPRSLQQGLGLWTIQAGVLPVFIALVPVLGWLVLPFVMVRLVAGFTWEGEQALLLEAGSKKQEKLSTDS